MAQIDLSAGLPATEIREQLRALGIGNAPRAGAGAGAGAGIGTEKQDTAAGDARREALLALPLSSLSRERVDFAAAEVEKTHDALRSARPPGLWGLWGSPPRLALSLPSACFPCTPLLPMPQRPRPSTTSTTRTHSKINLFRFRCPCVFCPRALYLGFQDRFSTSSVLRVHIALEHF